MNIPFFEKELEVGLSLENLVKFIDLPVVIMHCNVLVQVIGFFIIVILKLLKN